MTRLRNALIAAWLAVAAIGTSMAADPPGAAANRTHGEKPSFPTLSLPEAKTGGERAIAMLGNRLPEVAAWYGKSPEELTRRLRTDRRLHVDRRGRLFVEDELEAPLPAPTAQGTSLLTGALLPLDQTFLLHSRPGAKRTIYLNFKGAMVSGTAWNSSSSSIVALPFDTDGVPYSFSSAELERIQYIWQRVAEDFAPLDVDVTTEQPPADLLTRSPSTDQVFGTTVLVTSRTNVYSCSCGGVAYIGVFDDTTDFYKPALVFYDALGAGNEKYVAEAISHEAGHNMGLLHDGSATAGYYAGHGSGATGWAPIMGVGYYQALAQWSKGEYAGANNTQDDYAVMQSNGLPIRLDDHGDNIGAATPLQPVTVNGLTTLAADGVIERPTDVDVFSFTSGTGPLTVVVKPVARSPNLDVLVELRDGAGVLLANANPVDALPATLSTTLAAAGTFYVTVQGVGKGDPATTGYSKYGSLGMYAVAVSASATASQPPAAVLTATPINGTAPLTVAFNSSGSSDPDGTIAEYLWSFGDGSASATGPTASHTYAAAGSYTAQLKVTDNTGLSATKSVLISVNPVVTLVAMKVSNIAMSLSGNTRNVRAIAAVKVVNANGQAVSGASVRGVWSGVVSGSATATTGSSGVANLNSPSTRSRGTYTFTVTGVTLAGYSYQASQNTETSDSIAR